jgi:hypothetical protein
MSRASFEEILERARGWPKDWQDAAAFMLFTIEKDYPNLYVPTDEERADIEAGLAECERAEFATDEEVAAVFRRNRRPHSGLARWQRGKSTRFSTTSPATIPPLPRRSWQVSIKWPVTPPVFQRQDA